VQLNAVTYVMCSCKYYGLGLRLWFENNVTGLGAPP